jgi:hypothetical protein
LEKVTAIGGGGLLIELNDALTSLKGLENVTSISGNLWLFKNSALASLTGLGNVTTIGGDLWLEKNSALASLTGLENIDAGTISDLSIYYNDSLSNCEVESICDYLLSPNGTIDIHDNATGCNSQAEVEAACAMITVNDLTNNISFSIYPNPATDKITISTPIKGSLSILNLNGQQLLQQEITEPKTQLDISTLPSGVNFVRVTGEGTVRIGKFIKQ